MNIGGSDDPFPVYQASGGFNPFLTLAFVFIVLIFSGPIFGSLYPMAAAAAAATYFAVHGAVHALMPTLDVSERRPFALLATLVVFWPMSRLDHRLAARIAPYRLTRHVARVILIAAFLTPSTISEPVRSGWMPRSMLELRVLLADQRIYIVMIFWAIVAHLVLVRAKGFHARWDRGLEFVRLRPKSL